MSRVALCDGGLIDLAAPDPGRIRLDHIARTLARLCRFGGRTRRFYSVAQHSVLVWRIVERAGGSVAEQRAALMHDAAEAYVGDVVSPLKAMLGPAFDRVEGVMWAAIARRFGLDELLPAVVIEADRTALEVEAWHLFPLPLDFAVDHPLWRFDVHRRMPWPLAAQVFLRAARQLGLEERAVPA